MVSNGGLFSDHPHFCLTENFWHPDDSAATRRYFIIDASTSRVDRYAASICAYTDNEYRSMLREAGFGEVEFRPSLSGSVDQSQSDLIEIISRKQRAKP